MCMLLAASVLSATNYTAQYTAGDWLRITRTIVQTDSPCFGSGVSNACMNDGAVHPPNAQYGFSTNITLTVQNIGQMKDNFTPGELVFNRQIILFSPPSVKDGVITAPGTPPVTLTVLGFRPTRYCEKVAGGAQGLIVNTLCF